MRCGIAQSKIPAALDQELSSRDAVEFALHLESCDACRAAYEDAQAVDALVEATVLQPEATYNFNDLKKQLHTVDVLEEIRAYIPKLQARGPIPRFIAACLVLMLMVLGQNSSATVQGAHAQTRDALDKGQARFEIGRAHV